VNNCNDLEKREIGERLEYIFEAGYKVASLRSREIFNFFSHKFLIPDYNIKKIENYFIRLVG